MSHGYPRWFAKQTPDKPAVIMYPSGAQLTFAEMEAQANQFAHFLRSIGLRAGDRIAFRLENRIEVFPFSWGAQRAGMIYVAISNKSSFDEVSFILENSGASVLLCSAKDNQDMLGQISQTCAGHMRLLGLGAMPAGWDDWYDVLNKFPTYPIEDECCGTDMLYSSGTTGRPKGIYTEIDPSKPVDEMPSVASLGLKFFRMSSDTVYLSPAPIYHAAPLRFSMAVQYLGGTVVMLEKFDAEDVLRAIEKYKITHAQFVPTHFHRLLDLPPETRKAYDLSTLQFVIHAAAPCPVETKRQMIEWWGPIIEEYYSSSEGTGFTYINSADWLQHVGSVGRPLIGIVRICDENGNEVPTGTEGYIYFENARPFSYYGDDSKTAESTNQHGWRTIGDIGWVDAEGFLYLTDRKSFMIISGGVNVYPQEIENLLITHPKVRDVAVIGTPDRDLGEKVTAIIELYDHDQANEATATELMAFTRAHLGGVKVPRRIEFDPALPRTDTGKLLKRKLRDAYWQREA